MATGKGDSCWTSVLPNTHAWEQQEWNKSLCRVQSRQSLATVSLEISVWVKKIIILYGCHFYTFCHCLLSMHSISIYWYMCRQVQPSSCCHVDIGTLLWKFQISDMSIFFVIGNSAFICNFRFVSGTVINS